MKLTRILVLPFTLLADAATLGNIGAERSFTQQIFDAERSEQRAQQEIDQLKALADIITRAREIS